MNGRIDVNVFFCAIVGIVSVGVCFSVSIQAVLMKVWLMWLS